MARFPNSRGSYPADERRASVLPSGSRCRIPGNPGKCLRRASRSISARRGARRSVPRHRRVPERRGPCRAGDPARSGHPCWRARAAGPCLRSHPTDETKASRIRRLPAAPMALAAAAAPPGRIRTPQEQCRRSQTGVDGQWPWLCTVTAYNARRSKNEHAAGDEYRATGSDWRVGTGG